MSKRMKVKPLWHPEAMPHKKNRSRQLQTLENDLEKLILPPIDNATPMSTSNQVRASNADLMMGASKATEAQIMSAMSNNYRKQLR